MAKDLKKKDLALCIDRDGVINVERTDYVKKWEEFVFKPDFLEFFQKFQKGLNSASLLQTKEVSV